MNLSGNQKLGALLAAVLPLVASIYGQQAERRQQNQTRAAEYQARADAERQAADSADSAAAQQLNQAFKDVANPSEGKHPTTELCATLHTSLELLRQSAPTMKTEAVIAAWLTYRVEGDGRRLVCNCRRTIGIAYANWLKQMQEHVLAPAVSADGKLLHNELIFALTAANTECNPTQDMPAQGLDASPSPTSTPTSLGGRTREPTATGSPLTEPTPMVPGSPPPPPPPASPSLRLVQPTPGARIYFQVPDQPAKDRLRELQTALKQAGYRVHDIEIVGDNRAPACAELRYVYANDTPEATALLSDLNKPAMLSQLYGRSPSDQAQLPLFRIKRMSRYEGRSLNRVYELWLPRNGGQECK